MGSVRESVQLLIMELSFPVTIPAQWTMGAICDCLFIAPIVHILFVKREAQ